MSVCLCFWGRTEFGGWSFQDADTAAVEAAKKLLVQVFDALGAENPAVSKGRRRLANLMFV